MQKLYENLQTRKSNSEITMKIVGFIPARWNSSRFPGKPLSLLKGKTLIQHVYDNAKASEIFDKIIVLTDDIRIFEHACKFADETFISEKEYMCGTDRIADTLDLVEAEIIQPDLVFNLQIDEPYLPPTVYRSIKELFFENKDKNVKCFTAVSLAEFDAFDRNNVKAVLDKARNVLYFSRQPIPSVAYCGDFYYYKHIGIYAYSPRFLKEFVGLPKGLAFAENLEQLRILEAGYKIKSYITLSDSPSINTPEDLEKLEKIL